MLFRSAQEAIEGSVTLLILTEDDAIIAARDRLGRLPVLIGKDEEGYAVSFESFAYQKLGYEKDYELGPGEIVKITPEGYKTLQPAGEDMKICAFLWSYYGYPNSNYEGVNVEVMRYKNGEIMARDEAARGTLPEVDYVAGIPDSGVPHAMGYAQESGYTYARPFVKYTPTWPRSFTPASQKIRNRVAKMKQIPVPELIEGKKLLFVDDSIVRGTQLGETVEFLYSTHAKEVHMRSACPPIMYGCKYLNFTSKSSEDDLLARRIIHELEGLQEMCIRDSTMSKRVNPSINALSTLVIVLITAALTVVNVIPVIREKQGKSGAALGKRGMAVCMAVVVAITGVSIAMLRKGGGASPQDAIAKYGSDTLKLYIPGEYMSEELIPNFEKEYGVKVIAEFFDSNEMMYTKLQAGDSYDVVVPSDYMIQRMLADDALQELDKDLIPNLDNLTPEVKNLPYDPDNTYSVPYFWGSVGIIYNHNNVDPAEVEEQGFDILRNPKYKGHIYMYDSERDAFMVALKALGYSMNTSDADEIQAAYEWLLDMNNTMNPTYVTDEVIDGMANGNKDIAIVYSGDATYVQSENEDMSYWMPKEGTNLWYDAMVVPKNAQNPLLAQEFINYTLTYEAALGNSEYVGYTSPNEEVMLELSGEEGMYGAYEAYIPRSGYEKDEVFQDNPILKKKIAELWIKVKASKG